MNSTDEEIDFEGMYDEIEDGLLQLQNITIDQLRKDMLSGEPISKDYFRAILKYHGVLDIASHLLYEAYVRKFQTVAHEVSKIADAYCFTEEVKGQLYRGDVIEVLNMVIDILHIPQIYDGLTLENGGRRVFEVIRMARDFLSQGGLKE